MEFLNENYEDGMEQTDFTQFVTWLEPIRYLSVEMK